MTSVDINLLAAPVINRRKQKKLKLVRRVAIIFLFIVGGLSLLSFFLNLSSPINSIKKQQEDVISQITAQQQKAAKIQIVNGRVSVIKQIYSQRPDFSDILSLVSSKQSEDTSLKGLDIEPASVSVTFSSISLLSLNNLLNGLIDGSKKEQEIKSVFLEDLSVSSTQASYTMTVEFNLK